MAVCHRRTAVSRGLWCGGGGAATAELKLKGTSAEISGAGAAGLGKSELERETSEPDSVALYAKRLRRLQEALLDAECLRRLRRRGTAACEPTPAADTSGQDAQWRFAGSIGSELLMISTSGLQSNYV